jgi:hypothetical protein
MPRWVVLWGWLKITPAPSDIDVMGNEKHYIYSGLPTKIERGTCIVFVPYVFNLKQSKRLFCKNKRGKGIRLFL